MKTACVFLFIVFPSIVSFAQPVPTWRAIVTTVDAPFVSSCDGQQPLNNHVLAYIYWDREGDGPDATDGAIGPVYLGQNDYEEGPAYSFSNFPLEANGTLRSPLFWGKRRLTGPEGSLQTFLRIFIGQNSDSCYTSPPINIPDDDTIHEIAFLRSQWICGAAPVNPPRCHGSTSMLDLGNYIEANRQACITTCNGSIIRVCAPATGNSFRPPVIQAMPGCSTGCEPATAFHFSARYWEQILPDIYWSCWFHGYDVGCVHFNLLQAIPCAQLDTMTATAVDSNVILRWNTLQESSLSGFLVMHRSDSLGFIPALRNPNGEEYSFTCRGMFRVYPIENLLLVMLDDDGNEYGAAYSASLRMSAVAKECNIIPIQFSLSSFPNPFNPATTISFSLPRAGRTDIRVYDVMGREVRTLQDGLIEAGEHRVTFDGSGLPSGIYFARMQSGEYNATQKLLLIK